MMTHNSDSHADRSPIPSQLQSDLERIAKAVHGAWMHQRKSEGWTYGLIQSEAEKTTPFMVDFESLPELEKEMDRVTVRQTIRTLLELGYRIER